jgi:uncharacterized repeat protein (TIGR03803 family)
MQQRRWIAWMCSQLACVELVLAIGLGSAVVAAQSAPAPSYREKVLYNFCTLKNCADGQLPHAGLIRDAKGNLYGTTVGGGASGIGNVFKLDPTGKEIVLYSFTGTGGDGQYPETDLIRDRNGNLYGTTLTGGDGNGHGTVFKLNASGKETVLYRFMGGSDGASPNGVFRDAKGNLYGTTYAGGGSGCYHGEGCGTVFKLNPSGEETVLYRFNGGSDGSGPTAGVIQDSKGNLFGTTGHDGDLGCECGTVFKLDKSGDETVLHRFISRLHRDGNYPFAGVIRDANGSLYGTTYSGGHSSYGTVFEIEASGGETVLYSFMGGTDGRAPLGGLMRDTAGTLYGTTQSGGAHGYGYGIQTRSDRQGDRASQLRWDERGIPPGWSDPGQGG